MSEPVFLFGASGHAKVVIDAISCAAVFEVALLFDDDVARHGTHVLGQCVVGGRDALLERCRPSMRGIVAIGANEARLKVADWLRQQGFGFISAVHPHAVISASAQIGVGTLVMPGCVINADARIGDHAIINTAATVDHDCIVGTGAHLGPGSHLCGGVEVGRGSLIGAGAVLTPGVNVGAGVVVGAGSTVLADLADGVCAAGTPCRILERRT